MLVVCILVLLQQFSATLRSLDSSADECDLVCPSTSGILAATSITERPVEVKDVSTSTMVDGDQILSWENMDENGINCPVCLQPWEASGEHRLVSLKCGHLFGYSCLDKWLKAERQSVCPSCRTPVNSKDIWNVHAQRIYKLDCTAVSEMQKKLAEEKEEVESLISKMLHERNKNVALKSGNEKLKLKLAEMRKEIDGQRQLQESLIQQNHAMMMKLNINGFDSSQPSSLPSSMPTMAGIDGKYSLESISLIKLPLENKCRMMLYGQQQKTLYIANRIKRGVFLCSNIRSFDVITGRASALNYVARPNVWDISLNQSGTTLTAVYNENKAKCFETQSMHNSLNFVDTPEKITACAHDTIDDNRIYLGGNSMLNTYDMRNTSNYVSQIETPGDNSPVIHIGAVSADENFPYGGVFICKLQSVWFSEYTQSSIMPAIRFAHVGPFLTFRFDKLAQTLIFQTRSGTSQFSTLKVARVVKVNGNTELKVLDSISVGQSTPFMCRSSQISVEGNNLIMGYLQDTKSTFLYDQNCKMMVQQLNSETMYDVCPLYAENQDLKVAALYDNQIHTYKLHDWNTESLLNQVEPME